MILFRWLGGLYLNWQVVLGSDANVKTFSRLAALSAQQNGPQHYLLYTRRATLWRNLSPRYFLHTVLPSPLFHQFAYVDMHRTNTSNTVDVGKFPPPVIRIVKSTITVDVLL